MVCFMFISEAIRLLGVGVFELFGFGNERDKKRGEETRQELTVGLSSLRPTVKAKDYRKGKKGIVFVFFRVIRSSYSLYQLHFLFIQQLLVLNYWCWIWVGMAKHPGSLRTGSKVETTLTSAMIPYLDNA